MITLKSHNDKGDLVRLRGQHGRAKAFSGSVTRGSSALRGVTARQPVREENGEALNVAGAQCRLVCLTFPTCAALVITAVPSIEQVELSSSWKCKKLVKRGN